MKKYLPLLLVLFLFRLGFGLCSSFWLNDPFQTYLIGLKCYTTQTWPYFGPDVAGEETPDSHTQVPGALEGLAIAGPLFVWPIPEAPYIFLNLLSTIGLGLFCWYCTKRLPQLSPWFIWLYLWMLTWPLHEGSIIFNPCYLLFGSCLFFTGFFETLPGFRLGLLPRWACNLLMGFAVFWCMQFHLSWVLLVPFDGISLYFQAQETGFLKNAAFLALGAIPPALLIVPTFLKYGLFRSNASNGFVTAFNWGNFLNLPTILARYLSLASFEIPFFLGGAHTKERFAFLTDHPYLVVPGAFLWVIGWVQVAALIYLWFSRKNPSQDWKIIKGLFVFSLTMIWMSFWFTTKSPRSHLYFVLFPLVALYALYAWSKLASSPRWRLFAKVYVIATILFEAGFPIARFPGDSLYRNRDIVVKAIQEKNYHLVGERVPTAWY